MVDDWNYLLPPQIINHYCIPREVTEITRVGIPTTLMFNLPIWLLKKTYKSWRMTVLLNESVVTTSVAVSDTVSLLEQFNLPPEPILWWLIWQMLSSPSLTESTRESLLLSGRDGVDYCLTRVYLNSLWTSCSSVQGPWPVALPQNIILSVHWGDHADQKSGSTNCPRFLGKVQVCQRVRNAVACYFSAASGGLVAQGISGYPLQSERQIAVPSIP